MASLKGTRAVLGGVPDAQDVHYVARQNSIDQHVGPHREQLASAGQRRWSSPAWENGQAVAGDQNFARYLGGGNRVFSGDVGSDARHVAHSLGRPDNAGHGSARLRRGRVEFAFREALEPGTNILVRHATRIGFRRSNCCGQGLRLGSVFVVLDQCCLGIHANIIAHRRELEKRRPSPICRPWPVSSNPRRNKSLLLLFFRKEDLPFFYAMIAERSMVARTHASAASSSNSSESFFIIVPPSSSASTIVTARR